MPDAPSDPEYGAFAPVFADGPGGEDGPRWYLILLNLYDHAPDAVSAVARCVRTAEDPAGQIVPLFGGRIPGWRPQLVACVATLVTDAEHRPLGALVDAACGSSWVIPQILATCAFVGPDGWVERVRAAALDRSDPKAAAALVSLLPHRDAGLVPLAAHDIDGGGEIARQWGDKLRAAFDAAGVAHSW